MQPGRTDIPFRVDQSVPLVNDMAIGLYGDCCDLDDPVVVVHAGRLHVDGDEPLDSRHMALCDDSECTLNRHLTNDLAYSMRTSPSSRIDWTCP